MGLVKEPMERSTITMEPADWAVVYQIAKDMGLSSRSAGVRFIIRDWQRLKATLELRRPLPPIDGQPHAPAIRMPAIANACAQLGWQIVGQPQVFPEGTVYFCRDAGGIVEPYTARAILAQLEYLHAYFDVILTLADLSTHYAARLCLPLYSPCVRGPALSAAEGELEGGSR